MSSIRPGWSEPTAGARVSIRPGWSEPAAGARVSRADQLSSASLWRPPVDARKVGFKPPAISRVSSLIRQRIALLDEQVVKVVIPRRNTLLLEREDEGDHASSSERWSQEASGRWSQVQEPAGSHNGEEQDGWELGNPAAAEGSGKGTPDHAHAFKRAQDPEDALAQESASRVIQRRIRSRLPLRAIERGVRSIAAGRIQRAHRRRITQPHEIMRPAVDAAPTASVPSSIADSTPASAPASAPASTNASSSTGESAPQLSALEEALPISEMTDEALAVARFNGGDPVGALRSIGLEGESRRWRAATWLHQTSGLDTTILGGLLGDPDQRLLMAAYVHKMQMEGLDLLDGMRRLLGRFRLPGEAQKIDRIMQKFAERYCSRAGGLLYNIIKL